MLHNVGSLIVIFNSARLVRKGEELEHFHPEPPNHRARIRKTGQLTPKAGVMPQLVLYLCPSLNKIRHPPKSIRQKSGGEVVVSVRGLTKVFKDFWNRPKARAVDNVDFEVRRGEVFGLLGPNGSGKSTTVKLLLGLLNPTKGHIEVFGHSPRHVQTKSRIGYLPEESYLYRYLNSRETLDFFGNLFHLSKGRTQQSRGAIAGNGRPRQNPDARRRRIFQGHAAPHRAGAGAHQRSRSGDSRRTDRRPRPDWLPRGEGFDLALARRGKTVI
jgi:hypothetical protein